MQKRRYSAAFLYRGRQTGGHETRRKTQLIRLCREWVSFRVFDYFYGKVYIEVGPVEVTVAQRLDIEKFACWAIPEPGEIFKRHEKLPALRQ
jgi:hypothetical protein